MALTGSAVGLGVAGSTLGLVLGFMGGRYRGAPSEDGVGPIGGDVAVERPVAALDSVASPTLIDQTAALRARFCEAELAAVRSHQQMVEPEWPDQAGPEEPGRWAEVLDQAIEGCSLPLSVEQVDCSVYPCVARVQSGPDSVAERVPANWADCPALQALMPDANMELFDTYVTCPDGGLKRVEVAFLFREETVQDVIAPYLDDDWDEFVETARLFARRFDAAASTADCGD